MVGKETLKIEEVITVLLETEKFKKPTSNYEGGAFVVKSEARRGRGMSRGKNFDREKSRSMSQPRI